MLIVQITDIHLGFEAGNPRELNQRRLERTIAAIHALDVAPDLVLATGDLTDHGAPEAYGRVKAQFERLPCPVFPIPGNHDMRATFLDAFPDRRDENGFVQYALDDFPLRILALDTLEEGRHGGGFCEARAAWLEARLAEASERPTLIALHHPPADVGVTWMGAAPGEPWTTRLTAVIARHPQVVALVSGHLHRPISTMFAGAHLIVSPATAPSLTLTLGDVSVETEDHKPLVDLGPPAFAVHQWTGGRLISHFEIVSDRKVLASNEGGMHALVRHLADERSEV